MATSVQEIIHDDLQYGMGKRRLRNNWVENFKLLASTLNLDIASNTEMVATYCEDNS